MANYTTVFAYGNSASFGDALCATAYRILTGGGGASQDPPSWSASDVNNVNAISFVLRPAAAGNSNGAQRMFLVF
jgi:hypothetical protein